MFEVVATPSDLRTLSPDELHAVSGAKPGQAGSVKPIVVKVCVERCILGTRSDGSTVLKCEPPKCSSPKQK
jgi:hypothetical protein